MKRLLIILILLSYSVSAQIVINEYSAANYNGYTDSYGETEDWFELYNSSAIIQDLNGYFLSDKASNLTKYQINSSVQMNSNEHLIVFASGRNEINGSEIHTNFKLHQTKGNEWIILTAPDGVSVVDSIFILPCLTDHSRGRSNDADSNWGVFTNPSPNTSNSNSLINYTTTPEFSYEPGNYPSSINLEITCSDGNTSIYYTTDGSVPTTGSNLYNSPININSTTVIKAIAVSTNTAYLPSFMEYGTFFINDTYTLPVMSVSGNQLFNLLDGNGWIEPHGTFEYYKNGVLADKARGEFNEHGNDSWAYPQRGFDYITRDQFGYNYAIQDELFRTKDRDKYQRLIIKAAANDNYPFSYGGSGAHIRDSYVQSLSQIADLRMDERSFEPCILFLNGEYWGLYEIREKVDDIDFTDYYYDQDDGEVDFLKTWGGTWIEYGTDTGWTNIRNYILTNDMSDQDNYDHVKSFYNTGSLIDYFILNSYVVNADWLNWNTAWWRGTNPDGDKKKWRYVLWDMDNTFDHGANYTGVPDTDPDADPCDPESIGDPGGQGHIPIWNALLNNDEFFADYINRWTDLSNSYFSCESLLGHLDSLIGMIEPEMPMQINRWGGNLTTWQNNVQDMRDFIEDRCAIINNGILDCYEDDFGIEGPYEVTIIVEPPLSGEVELNGFDLDSYPFIGDYFGGVQQELEANAYDGYSFSHWEFNNSTPQPNNTSEDIFYNLNSNETITAHFSINSQLTFDVVGNGNLNINNVLYTTFPDSIPVIQTTTIEAIPESNYLFDHWELSSGTIDNPSSPSTTISITENAQLIAYFIPYPELSLNALPTGSVEINNTNYNNLPTTLSLYGNQNFEAIPEVGYQFDYWEYNGSETSIIYDSIASLFIYENAELTAHFSKIQLQVLIDISHSEGGSIRINDTEISPLPSVQTFIYGDNYTIELDLNNNYLLNHWQTIHTNLASPFSELLNVSFTENDTLIAQLDQLFNLNIIVEPENGGLVYGNGSELLLDPLSQVYYANTAINLEAVPTIDMDFKYYTRKNAILEQNRFFDYTIESDDTLRVIFSEKDLTLYIPNSFTPNGDNINDHFKPICNPSKINDYQMLIFNEWGNLVFESNSIDNGWGADNVNLAKNNVFVYKIVVRSSLTNSTFEYTGTVLVL